ncbi:MAG: GNAT family N-acetyltransferase [Candidatus Sumerlaeia bacterium]
MEAVIIRKAEVRDLEAMASLLELLFSIEEDFTPRRQLQLQGLEMMLRDDARSCIMLAEVNSRVVGMGTIQLLISTAEGGVSGMIEDMIIQEEYRGRGLGRRIIAALEEWLVAKGGTRLQLLADKNNSLALDFYKRLGWRNTRLICLRKMPGHDSQEGPDENSEEQGA